jgi:hypothetical protein
MFKKWEEFLATLTKGKKHSDPYLQSPYYKEAECLALTTLFTEWLRVTMRLSDQYTKSVITGVNSCWIAKGLVSPFNRIGSDAKKRIAKAHAPSKEEQRQQLRKQRERETRAVPQELRALCYTEFWDKQMSHAPDSGALDLMGATLAIACGCDTASRGANFVTTSSTEHAIQSQDLRFQVGVGEAKVITGGFTKDYDSFIEVSGDLLPQTLSLQEDSETCHTGDRTNLWDPARVASVALDHLTSKYGPVANLGIGRRTVAESAILDKVITWAMLCRPKADEPFLTRYGTTARGWRNQRRVIRSSDIKKVLQLGAKSLGLPERYFSTKSLRQTGITELGYCQVTKAQSNQRSGHHPDSDVGERYYNFGLSVSMGGRGPSVGPSALQQPGDEGFTISKFLDTVSRSDVPGARGSTTSTDTNDEPLPSSTTDQGATLSGTSTATRRSIRKTNTDPNKRNKRDRTEDEPTLTRSRAKRPRAMKTTSHHTS